MAGLAALTAAGGAMKYIRRNRWTWYVIGGLALVGVGFYIARSHGTRIKAVFESTSTVATEKTETVLANANIIITATGGRTEVTLDEFGVPNRITNEGGELHVQAIIATSRSTSGSMARTETTSSSFESSGPSRTWEWGVRAGGEYGRDGWTVPVGLERRLFGSLGVEASANVPIEGDDILKRTRFGAAIRARF